MIAHLYFRFLSFGARYYIVRKPIDHTLSSRYLSRNSIKYLKPKNRNFHRFTAVPICQCSLQYTRFICNSIVSRLIVYSLSLCLHKFQSNINVVPSVAAIQYSFVTKYAYCKLAPLLLPFNQLFKSAQTMDISVLANGTKSSLFPAVLFQRTRETTKFSVRIEYFTIEFPIRYFYVHLRRLARESVIHTIQQPEQGGLCPFV